MAEEEKASTGTPKDKNSGLSENISIEPPSTVLETTTTEVCIIHDGGHVEVTSNTATTERTISGDEDLVSSNEAPIEQIEEKISSPNLQENGAEDESKAPSNGTRKKKPLSPSMQRLTAKKEESPESSRKNNMTVDERKAKADALRKNKILESHNKQDQKRAAVLERKRKLDDAERERKEALFKRLTVGATANPTPKASTMKKRYSASTSNLAQLKKTKMLQAEIGIADDSRGKPPPNRPSSALQPTGTSLTSNLHKAKGKKTVESKKLEVKQPMTAEPRKVPTKPPSSRYSLNPRPASALGVSISDRRKTLQTLPTKPTAPVKATSSTKSVATKPVTKSKPASTLPAKKSDTKTECKAPVKKEVEKKTPHNKEMHTLKAVGTAPAKKSAPTKTEEKPKTTPKKPSTKNTTPKTTLTKPPKPPGAKAKPTIPKSSSKNKPEKTAQMTEEEAKKALAERRKQAKEEAEAKAKAERENDEMESLKREEEERRLAEQLKEEEERQTGLLEQLKKEEDERRQKMVEEKEKRDKEEKERLDEEQKQREEEIDRKAKLELEKIQKEQEKKEQTLDAERIERKRRVEMIMARVSAKRNASTGSPASDSPPNEAQIPTDNEEQLNTDHARLKVDGILRSRGLGRSTEDLLDISNKADENDQTEAATPHEFVADEKEVPEINDEGTLSERRIETITTTNIKKDEPLLPEGDLITVAETKIESTLSQLDATCQSMTDVSSATNSVETMEDIPSEKLEDIIQVENSSSIKKLDPAFTDKPEPVDAWLEKQTVIIDTESKPIEITEKQHIDLVEPDNESSEIIVNKTVDSNIRTTVSTEPEEESKVIIVNNNILLTNGDTMDSKDLSNTSEQEQWGKVEERMKEIQPEIGITNGNPDEKSEESKLWRVVEGKVELSECF